MIDGRSFGKDTFKAMAGALKSLWFYSRMVHKRKIGFVMPVKTGIHLRL